MKLASDESNGPVSPVWRSLKGLSSRDIAQAGPLSPGASSLGTGGFSVPGDSPSSVVARQGGSLYSSRASPLDGGRRASTRLSLESGDTAAPKSEDSLDIQPEVDTFQKPPFGRSSSTVSTSLSNPNLADQSNPSGMSGPLSPISPQDALTPPEPKDDPQVFSSISLIHGVTSPFIDLYRHNRLSNKKMRRRIVHKNGECNITKANVAKRRKRFLQDLFTTLLDIQWRWTLLIFALSFVLSWTLFAALWYAIVYNHGDLLPEHLPDRQHESGWAPCVMNIFSFASCFLFSVETQHTIGYGSRHTTEQCPEAIFVMCLQSITGVILQAFMGGVIFTKLSRPKKRTHTLIFSRQACICQRDGDLCLLFRVGDMRKSHIIEAHIRVQLIKERVTEEGETIPFYQHELDVGYDGGEDRILFIWPMTIVHKIDEGSPLYEVSAHDMSRAKFEIIVMLEGVIENTGMTIQARSSYLPSEIRWGYSFRQMFIFREDIGECTVDYSLFNEIYEIATPLCSAKYLQEASSASSTAVTPSAPSSPLPPFSPDYRINEGTPPSGCNDGAVGVIRSVSLTDPRWKKDGTDKNTNFRRNSSKRRQRTGTTVIAEAAPSEPEQSADLHRVRGQNSHSMQPLLESLGKV